MRLYTKAGELAFSTFKFPDGQPHFRLETVDHEFHEVTIESRIGSLDELFEVMLATDVLRGQGYTSIKLNIRYLLGARMDRAIDAMSPMTLAVIARMINSCGFSKVTILDVHSPAALHMIHNSKTVVPQLALNQVLNTGSFDAVVVPDKGAVDRIRMYAFSPGIVFCVKRRDPQTGKLSGFAVDHSMIPLEGANLLIVDDICDGGGTFTGLAEVLLAEHGAKSVSLFVTHGIFSKGLPIKHIHHVFTTDSLYKFAADRGDLTVIPVRMG